jgi:hypothetical protein
MYIASFAVLTISGVLTPFAASQESQDPVAPARTYTPVEVVAGPVQKPEVSIKRDITVSEVSMVALRSQPEGVPLPIRAQMEPGPDGDRIVQEASGNPYFLGFTAGSYYPPQGELVDPLILRRYRPDSDLRPGDFTYAFVMFSERMTADRLAQLESAGCRLLGSHPHYTMKVALSSAALSEVSTLPFVRWVGSPQSWQKLSPSMQSELAAEPSDMIELAISLYESDLGPQSVGTPTGTFWPKRPGLEPAPDVSQRALEQLPKKWQSHGWQQQALEAMGMEIRYYAPRGEAFVGSVRRDRLEALVELDFVQFIEPVPQREAMTVPHEDSTPMIMTDHIRADYDGGTNKVAIVGIVDTGIEDDHVDLDPISGIGWKCFGGSAWDDTGNHGTHVAGTLLGRGIARAGARGNAPGIASWGEASALFNVRAVDDSCSWDISTLLSYFDNSYTWTSGNITPKPHLVTNSWAFYYDTNNNGIFDSGDAGGIGTELWCRILDNYIYDEDQAQIFGMGNAGPGSQSLSITAAAKNVLSVGSVQDFLTPGAVSSFSSRGPAGDGRWKPNVCAPGDSISSCSAIPTIDYTCLSGTSMATPHVSAVAATLVDHYAWARYDPALLSAVLMASAMTRNDKVLTTPGDSHLDSYGAGRVNAYKAHWKEQSKFEFLDLRSFTQNNSSGYGSGDFTVPNFTARLVVVMHYVEEGCSKGANQALVNDYDLWLDEAPFSGSGNSGEYSAHQSSLDNTEIRIIDDPNPGAWRWKTYPENAGSKDVKMAVAVYAILYDTTPGATLTLSVSDLYVQPDEIFQVTATVDPFTYIASAVLLDARSSSIFLRYDTATTTLYDGVVTDLSNLCMGVSDTLTLGDILYSQPRTAVWSMHYPSEAYVNVQIDATSDNMDPQSESLTVLVDGTEPEAVTNLTSSSHTKFAWSNDPNVTWTWSPALDGGSGLQGYGIDEDWACTLPITSLDLGTVTSYTGGPYPSSTQAYQFNIRSVDRSDNWDSDYVCDGPYFIDVDAPGIATFNSSDHTVGGKSCNPSITVSWNPAADAHSGVFGYDVQWSQIPITCPFSGTSNWQTQSTTTLAPGTWWCHVRAVDKAGNWATCTDAAHFGPFTIVPTCTLFSDDFESGDFAAGGWAISGAGRCVVSSKSAFNSFFGARLKKGGQGTGPCLVGTKQTWIRAPAVDTTGWSGVRVDMNARVKRNTLGCEGMALQWWDGSGWNLVGIIEKHAWAPYSFDLPAAALGNPALTMRLITNSKGKGERAEVDNFTVTGIE